ncbi:histidine phosphatase family protein [Microbacterium sp. BG28]|uniref:SixA phosphatase family protein n=1 Tax=Microbacterium sp. BG28 TaxID=3097356 RepID=UPI002A59ABB7|nr:histidine phosphatase family protein [Microbacterium sp. BG28]MDY0828600.1 histidine phosphatase family protein [Microbacterium sp. BG28]
MVTLVLVRHAKSDWGTAGLSDHERPLNDRGQRDAPLMAAALAETGFRPARLLSSTALRARTTAESFATALDVPLETLPELYGASVHELWDAAVATGEASVLIVAHDPGLSELASELAGRDVMMTTCAVATFPIPGARWPEAPPVVDEWSLRTPR